MKRTLKATLFALVTVLVFPYVVWHRFWCAVLGPNRALEGASQTLALLPGQGGVWVRRAFYRFALAECHPSAEISFGTLFSQAGATIGADVYIGPRCHLGLVHVERDVLIAAGVHIPSGGATHAFDDPDRPIREQGGERRPVRIGAGAWVGEAATVLADVGAGSVVGAGAVVTKPLPPNVVAAGVPARVLRPRFPDPALPPPDDGTP